MSQASPELVWQVIKKGNCFLRKGSNGRKDPIFSAEKGNLYARHSFKFSGVANLKTVDVAAGAGTGLRLAVTKSQAKRANKPAKKTASTVMAATSGRKVCKAVAADVAKFRPDLKDAAKRTAAAVQKSLRVKKAIAKKA